MTKKELLDRLYIVASAHYDYELPPSIVGLLSKVVDVIPEHAFEDVSPEFYLMSNVEEGALGFIEEMVVAHELLDKGIQFTLFISSDGGEVNDGMSIQSTINRLRRSGRVVHGHVIGIAASAAFDILQACDIRTIEPHGALMTHKCQITFQGTADQQIDEAKFSQKIDYIQYGQVSSRTGNPPSYYMDKVKNAKNWYLTAEEALREGLVDKILEVPHLPKSIVTTKPSRRKKKETEVTS